ncbi:hypothetical protein HDU76_008550 [Blyttiomyces sp. JEL0837]|nr:hypothetical protein HDU76_008550 [Blyttiomyces sp. JEL0837]
MFNLRSSKRNINADAGAPTELEIVEDNSSAATSSNQPQRILLVAVEPRSAEYVIDWTLNHVADPSRDVVVLLNVRPLVEKPVGDAYLDFSELILTAEEQSRTEAHNLLHDAIRQLKKKSPTLRYRAATVRGDARDELVSRAKEVGADMLIVGARGLNSISRALLGSVSDFCVHNVTSCPVLVVKN